MGSSCATFAVSSSPHLLAPNRIISFQIQIQFQVDFDFIHSFIPTAFHQRFCVILCVLVLFSGFDNFHRFSQTYENVHSNPAAARFCLAHRRDPSLSTLSESLHSTRRSSMLVT